MKYFQKFCQDSGSVMLGKCLQNFTWGSWCLLLGKCLQNFARVVVCCVQKGCTILLGDLICFVVCMIGLGLQQFLFVFVYVLFLHRRPALW